MLSVLAAKAGGQNGPSMNVAAGASPTAQVCGCARCRPQPGRPALYRPWWAVAFPGVSAEQISLGTPEADDLIIIDGQASPDLEELKQLAEDSDRVLIPTTPQKVSLLLAMEVAEVMQSIDADFRVVLTKCDSRQYGAIESARQLLADAEIPVLTAGTTLLNAFEQAEAAGTLVCDAQTDQGKKNPRAGEAWEQICTISQEITNGLI